MPVPNVRSTISPRVVLARAELFLGQAGGVGVVEHGHRLAVELGADDVARVGADPLLVDVGGSAYDAVGDHAGIGDAEAARPTELADHLAMVSAPPSGVAGWAWRV